MRIPLESYQNIRNEQGYLVLPKEFKCKEGKFLQLKRKGNIALYQRNQGYEVIVIQNQEPFEITKGVFTEKKENFPSSTTWGQLGWSYLQEDLKGAEKKYNELLLTKE